MASPAYRNWLMTRETTGKDPLVDQVLSGEIPQERVDSAKELYDDKAVKVYVEACLLATTDYDEMADVLGIPADVLKFYHDIYYDVQSLSRIHKVDHVSKITDTNERNLKQWAFVNGMQFVKWRLGMSPQMTPSETLHELASDAFYRSKEAFFNDNSVLASQEGLKWSKHATTLLKMVNDMSGKQDDAVADFQLALQRVTEENLGILDINSLER